MSSEQINWSHKSLEELQTFWNAQIEPDLARDGLDLDRRPRYQEIADAGYSGIAYALREHHELTLGQFLTTVGYGTGDADDEYDWSIADETTVQELELYLRSYQRRKGRAESTIDSKRSRLARYARTYADLYGEADLVERVRRDVPPRRDERQRVYGVLDTFDAELDSAESKFKHLTDVRLFYEWLRRDRDAAYNPASDPPHASNWKSETPNDDERDPPALESVHVRTLVDACDSSEDRLLVVAACAWGLRRGEIASIRRSQFELEDGDPRIVFGEERKNGPGTVTIHYGLETLEDRIGSLGDAQGWNGYLFPSSAAESGHVTGDTITARFKRLAERANVTVRGETPTPQYGRRFWYRTYLDAVERLSEQVQAVAEEQGSANATVVVENYLGEEEARKRRRAFMRERLEDAFKR
ncbi:tyrosine-type recombinase/integrase [Natronococcus wangiae]|uniref:tyrosine-type recombinase/integrase n=1 Tax=Natronococcus wangiae TaxID=3068275 RepID=UPI00273FFB73|nr:site-specific integrase [Natronococcus sp. AD5]